MSRSDDLTPLLAPDKPQGLGVRQGTVVSWNILTAENQVLIGGTLFTNLPILNTSEAAILAAGDVVTVLTAGNSWAIMGRYTIPGSPEAVSALSSLRTQSALVSDYDTTTSSTLTDLATVGPEVEIAVGPSGKVLIILTADIRFEVPAVSSAINTAGAYMAYEMSGANTASAAELLGMHHHVRTNGTGPAIEITNGASRTMLREGLTPGLTTFTCKYRRDTNGTCEFGNRTITVQAL